MRVALGPITDGEQRYYTYVFVCVYGYGKYWLNQILVKLVRFCPES